MNENVIFTVGSDNDYWCQEKNNRLYSSFFYTQKRLQNYVYNTDNLMAIKPVRSFL